MSVHLIYRIGIITILTGLILLGAYMMMADGQNEKNKKHVMPSDSFAVLTGVDRV